MLVVIPVLYYLWRRRGLEGSGRGALDETRGSMNRAMTDHDHLHVHQGVAEPGP